MIQKKECSSFPGCLQTFYIHDFYTPYACTRMDVKKISLQRPKASWIRISSIRNFANISSSKYCC